jgi:hypothetical protein
VLIPAAFRKALGINPCDEIILSLEEDGLRITKMKCAVSHCQLMDPFPASGFRVNYPTWKAVRFWKKRLPCDGVTA